MVNDLSGVRWASLLLAAGLFVFVSLAAVRLVPKIEATSHTPHEGEVDVKQLLGSAHSIPTYLILAVITFAGVGFPMAIIKLFAEDQFRMSESAFGLLVLPAALMMAGLSVPMAKFGDRLGKHRAVHFGMGLCTLGVSLIALGAFIPGLRTAWMLALGGIPLGLGFLLAIPAWMASVSDLDPKARAANVGAVMTAQGFGAIIGAPLGSFCYAALQPVGVQLGLGTSFGHYSPFVGCAVCVAAGWLLGLRILR
jgi:MFS family permease